jgi:septum formation inhibitor MinC
VQKVAVVHAPDTQAAEPELFGTETMAELCARQGRLGEAIRIFQRLLSSNPPPDKAARWADRCRSLERARAYAPDLALPEPTRPAPRREARTQRAPERPAPQPTAPVAPAPVASEPGAAKDSFDLGSEITAVTPPETVRSLDVTAVRSLESLARQTAVDADVEASPQAAASVPRKTPPHGYGAASLDKPNPTPRPKTPAPAAATAGAGARVPTPTAVTAVDPPEELPEPPHRMPLVITQPVRSGQVVYAAKNDLIVLGPVNSGGQVVADGNIHIYGALRGRAIAGAQGATDARIFCQKLEAELLAISGIYLIWDDIPRDNLGKPAQISLRGDACQISGL